MKKIYIYFLIFNSLVSYSQIINRGNIDYKDLNLKIMQTDEKGNISFKSNYKYLENVSLDSLFYKSDDLKIKGYLMKPKNISDKKLPLIIFNRGGNRDFGNLKPKILIYNLSYISSQGFVVAGSTYRGNKDSEGKDEFGGEDVNDIINLINSLKNEPYIDFDNIVLYGWSRGAMMTFKVLKELKNINIKTIIVGGAPSNLLKTKEERPEMEWKVFEKIIPNYKENKMETLKERSVIFWVDSLPKIPVLLIHGFNDKAVSVNQSLDLAKELKKYDIPCKLVIYEDEGHNIYNNKTELDMLILNWLWKYL